MEAPPVGVGKSKGGRKWADGTTWEVIDWFIVESEISSVPAGSLAAGGGLEVVPLKETDAERPVAVGPGEEGGWLQFDTVCVSKIKTFFCTCHYYMEI